VSAPAGADPPVGRPLFERATRAGGAAALVLLLLLLVVAPGPRAGPTATHPLQDGRVTVIAHRGASVHAPENTLAAFARALESGADALEMDVRLSADGVVVVIHDATVDRTTDGTGDVAALTLAELRALDAGARFRADGGGYPYRGTGVRIPTLAEVLDGFPAVPLVIEMKRGAGGDVAAAVAAVLTERGAVDRVVLASFDASLLRAARSRAPGVATAADGREAATFHLLRWVGQHRWHRRRAEMLMVPERFAGLDLATPATLAAAHRVGMELHVWTVNDEEAMRGLARIGVDGMLTDDPGLLARVLGRR
jgi:glycerophosphoryl diester phosphodiesterase